MEEFQHMKLEQIKDVINNNTTDGSINYQEVVEYINQETNSIVAKEKEKRRAITPHTDFLKSNGFESIEAFNDFVSGSKKANEELAASKSAYEELLKSNDELNANYNSLSGSLRTEKFKATAMGAGVKADAVTDFLKLLDNDIKDEELEAHMKAKLELYPTFSNTNSANFGKKSKSNGGSNGGTKSSPFAAMLESRKL